MPLISIITPCTPDRQHFLDRLAVMLGTQTLQDFEWLVDMHGGSIGAKRNRLVSSAKGNFIAHCDSDDGFAPDWLERSLAHLIQSKADITGLSDAYFASQAEAWKYVYVGTQPYVMEGTMFYRKEAWNRCRFANSSNGEGLDFCTNAGRIIPHGYITGFLATIHDSNTASHFAIPHMQRVPFETVNFASLWPIASSQ